MYDPTFRITLTVAEAYDLADAASSAQSAWAESAANADPGTNVRPYLDRAERFRQLALRLNLEGVAAQALTDDENR